MLVEGYKSEPIPKIEVHRRAANTPVLYLDDSHVVAVATELRLAEWNHELAARILTLGVGLPVQVFVLEEHHRIIRANRRAQQSRDV